MTTQAQKIQALLFVAGEAVSKQELGKLLGVPVQEVEPFVQEVAEAMQGHGLTVVTTTTHVQITTAPDVAEYLASFLAQEPGKLTKAAAEALALIAYRGPLSRYDVDTIRGVDSRGIIRSLLRRGVIRQIQKAGKTPLYDITEDFLTHLGVQNREELPDFQALRDTESVKRILDQEDTK